MLKTVFPRSRIFYKVIFCCNCSTGTVTRCLFAVPASQGGVVLFAPPRKAVAFLTTLSVCQKHGTKDFAACGQRSGLLALNPASIFEKLLDQKTFICLRLGICNTILRETNRIRFGKAGAHPQLALGIAIAPETLFRNYNLLIFEGNCDSLRSSLRFLLQFIMQFDLLRKCGLLAHASPTFLKNCWIKKLLFCLRHSIHNTF